MLRIPVLYNNLVNLQNTVPLTNTVDGNGRTVHCQNEVKRTFTVLFKVLKLNLSWEQRQLQLSYLPPPGKFWAKQKRLDGISTGREKEDAEVMICS
jgi:hypothetical protein